MTGAQFEIRIAIWRCSMTRSSTLRPWRGARNRNQVMVVHFALQVVPAGIGTVVERREFWKFETIARDRDGFYRGRAPRNRISVRPWACPLQAEFI